MLYLDSSVLVKRYLREPGSDVVAARCAGGDSIHASALAFAEVHAVFGRKLRAGELRRAELENVRGRFQVDWGISINVVELDARSLEALPDLVLRYPISGADAVHLSSALSLRDAIRLVPGLAPGETRLEFGVADRTLARFARECGLAVFNPEERD